MLRLHFSPGAPHAPLAPAPEHLPQASLKLGSRPCHHRRSEGVEGGSRAWRLGIQSVCGSGVTAGRSDETPVSGDLFVNTRLRILADDLRPERPPLATAAPLRHPQRGCRRGNLGSIWRRRRLKPASRFWASATRGIDVVSFSLKCAVLAARPRRQLSFQCTTDTL